MKNLKKISYSILVFNLFSCAHHIATAERPELKSEDQIIITREGSASAGSSNLTSNNDLQKYAYELGLNPEKGLTDDEKNQVIQRQKLRALERSLDSMKERKQYSKVLPYLTTDQEKIDFLSLPTIEGRQAWVNRNKIWSRSKVDKEYLDVVEAQDLTLGMTQDLVRKSWGEPESVEYSGNPIYKNEKWRYLREIPSPHGYKRERRFVYFEGGRVVGWETE